MAPRPDAVPGTGRGSRGSWLVVAGPDGVGKTTLARGLVDALAPTPTLQVHHRFAVLPRSARSLVPSSDPHGTRPYPRWLAALKVVYLYLDLLGGWALQVRPARRRGAWVVHERGWLDLLVDPRRYRLQGVARLLAALSRVAPRPDVTLLLDAPASVMRERAPELTLDELDRQRAAWRRLAARHGRTVVLDSRRPVAALVGEALAAVRDAEAGPQHEAPASSPRRSGPQRWARFPMGGAPRWIIPVWPPAVAAAGLSVYQPMTGRGLVGWSAARVAARRGGLLLLGRAQPPPQQASLVGHIAADAVVAVGYGRRPGRAVALVLDPSGRPVALAKLRTDAGGPAALAHEAEMVERWAPLLPAGVTAPRVLAHGDGLLLFEAVAWQARLRPWLLPLPVAAGLGTLYRAGGGDTMRGPAHGDFAPWNLLRVEAGWMLVDWADATAEAMPFFDPLHYLVQAHALLGRPSVAAIVAGLTGGGWVGGALRAYATAAGLDAATAAQRCAEYLTATLPAMDLGRADGRRGARARRRLLAALSDMPAAAGFGR